MEQKTENPVVLGSTGLVGRHLLDVLLSDPEVVLVKCPVRRSSGRVHPKLLEIVVDFSRPGDYPDAFAGDTVFSCFGTNITQTRNRKQWRYTDVDLVLKTAALCREKGARALAVVSSIGASPGAGSFYLRLKGEMEEGLKAAGFDKLLIIRPSFLLGRREKIRWHEEPARWVMQFFGLFMWGKAAGFKAIHASVVARAMVRLMKEEPDGHKIITSATLRKKGKLNHSAS